MNNVFRKGVALLVASLATSAAQSSQRFPNMPTAAELAALPEYCQARIGQSPQLYEVWQKRMGHDKFIHVHHYCHGLNKMNRAARTFDKETRRRLLQEATQDFDYVIRNWPPDFHLTIDAKKRKAIANSMLVAL